MKEKEKYGLLKYPMAHKCNIGDYIQSLAAKQFLPKIDTLVDREHISDYQGDNIKLILNGWFMHNPKNWPPPKSINPLFVSFHINSLAKKSLTNHESIAYFKSLNKSIGCRDKDTVEALKSRGIDAYFSGCLTTTLGYTYKRENVSDEILFVDALYHTNSFKKFFYTKRAFFDSIVTLEFFKFNERNKILSKIFDRELLDRKIEISNMFPQDKFSEQQRFDIADKYLRRFARAKLVVTSRIHCALPCIAIGTPVIFLSHNLDSEASKCRFDGILDLLNVIRIDESENLSMNFQIDSNKIGINTNIINPQKHLKMAKDLIAKCKDFINE